MHIFNCVSRLDNVTMPVFRHTLSYAKKPFVLFILYSILAFGIGWIILNTLKTRKEMYTDQAVIDYIAANLKIRVKAGDTAETVKSVQITLSNTGDEKILFGHWRIYLYGVLPTGTNKTEGFEIGWINGGLFFLSPIEYKFPGISAGESLALIINEWTTSAKFNHFPNWYVGSEKNGITIPRIIESTRDESLSFVEPFKNSFQWKRDEFDMYNPYTPTQRFKMNSELSGASIEARIQVIPTPFSVKKTGDKNIDFDTTWVVVRQPTTDSDQAFNILAKKLGLEQVHLEPKNGKYIKFERIESIGKEAYEIIVQNDPKAVVISSSGGKGALYAVQTLISMLNSSTSIPEMVIKDHPRFIYRGLMIDVARNFYKKETIKKLIDVIAMYKMNKLHMHLTDNEGWRIEIPEIPELTKYGSQRCNHFENDKCLTPALGSGPFSGAQGSGFYSVDTFREILLYAKERYVEIIPEIDVPGHAFSAIKAMQFREQDLQQLRSTGRSYILSDAVSGLPSVQHWLENSINPCINATYRFIETVLINLQKIYEGIQKLELVHIGGDEVPRGVWENSEVCQSMFRGSSLDHDVIKEMFLFKIADIAYRHKLKISVWEDGIYNGIKGPYDTKKFKQKEVYVNTWNNIWEYGAGGRAIEFADVGYKVILSMATHLYFDHPYEPDPDERGLYWATRYTDTYKVFGFMPMDVYANADYDLNGNRIKLTDLCQGPCPNTKASRNFVGMEACVWSETIRNESQLMSMIFPRLLALAERAWHEAKWESLQEPEKREIAKKRDFKRFVNSLEKNELSRLEKVGVPYRIPPPGLSFSEDTRIARVNNLYSRHNIMVALGTDNRWRSVGTKFQIPKGISVIHAYAVSPLSKRKSRTVSLHIMNGSNSIHYNISCMCTFSIILGHLMVKIYFN